MQPTPLLKDGIRISPYDGTTLHAAPRFLLECEGRYFLISAGTRALILALLRQPSSDSELEQAFVAEGGPSLSATKLHKLGAQTLPPALLRDSPTTNRIHPFFLSMELMPAALATKLGQRLTWLFQPGLVAVLLSAFAILHLFTLPGAMQAVHGNWQSMGTVPLLLTLLVLSGLLHELGHISACCYFRCPHGGIGIGLYLIFPTWFADVSHAWRLTRRQRAVVDLGGVYFQAILLIGLDAWALLSGDSFILQLIWMITFTMLFTLNPMFKFDGYWLLSDLSGLHNLHQQMRGHIVNLLLRALGRSNCQARRPMQMWILHIYTLLSGAYLLYFGHFLLCELLGQLATLPQQLQQIAQEFDSGAELLSPVLHLTRDLLWPIMLILTGILLIKKILRVLHDLATEIRSPQQSL
ncbi:hypothetical protein [Massilia sp. BJB1822]|uniref:hypothetical protein n=1 Tax=Massilia sp. BJB1822 TaxID=2744470 RepID=UPI001594000A|nr:hypothetical protein [Massilia sp. BJB1822]NVE00400.1 hypothetical protein [Massilia sp. BJB1822]